MATHAPYNFVPLSNFVYTPEWGKHVSQDIPFKDGYCGTIDLTITTKTPLLIGGDRNKSTENTVGEVKAFITPDGNYAIPGSSLRGMIRNVLTIASFGKMNQVNDVRLGFRDLRHKDYQNRLTDNSNGNIKPHSNAGYLNYDNENNQWVLTPCEHHRIESFELNTKLTGRLCIRGRGQPNSLKQKYKLWFKQKNILERNDFLFAAKTFHNHDRNFRLRLQYGKAKFGGTENGALVFTGQPSLGNHSKHMEFVFHTVSDDSIAIKPDSNVWKDFKLIYIDGESEEWKFLKSGNHGNPNGIPVFYLKSGGEVRSIGLSQMFKIAYKNSIGDLIKKQCEDHFLSDFPDLAELIFGHLDEHKNRKVKGLKARAHFGLAKCTIDDYELEDEVTTVLNSPKASFYPNYLAQPGNNGNLANGQNYKTYEDKDAQIRGWKRYLIQTTCNYPALANNVGDKLKVKFKAIPANTTFTSKLHIHNMKAEEIGALVWALTWGGAEGKFHNIGMGKPLGMGHIALKINDIALTANDPDGYGVNDVLGISILKDSFASHMETLVENWQQSKQISELLAMAGTDNPKNRNLDYMTLPAHAQAKQDRYILPPHSGAVRDDPVILYEAPIPIEERGFRVGDWAQLPAEEGEDILMAEIIEMEANGNPKLKFSSGFETSDIPLKNLLIPKKQPNQ